MKVAPPVVTVPFWISQTGELLNPLAGQAETGCQSAVAAGVLSKPAPAIWSHMAGVE